MITTESNNIGYVTVSGTLTATAKDGYYFNGWYNGDSLISSDAAYSITATKSITASASAYNKITVKAGK